MKWSKSSPAGVQLTVAVTVAVVVTFSHTSWAYYGFGTVCPECPPPMPESALDTPLRWYFMPRQAGCAYHEYQYRVETATAVPTCCGRQGAAGGLTELPAAGPYSPEIVDLFGATGFVRLGQIPNDSLLDAAAAGQ
jgi:hypothetical protein